MARRRPTESTLRRRPGGTGLTKRAGAAAGCALIAVASLSSFALSRPQRLPDLAVKKVSKPKPVPGNGLNFKYVVKNTGKAKAKPSKTRFYLSRNAKKDKADIRLVATQKVKKLPPRKTAKAKVVVALPAALPLASYYLLVCSDDLQKLKEASDKNNCRASKALTLGAAAPSPGPTPAPVPPRKPPVAPGTGTKTPTTPSTGGGTADSGGGGGTTPDTAPPETTISAGPSGTVTADSVSFAFSSSESGGRFECRLDLNGWLPCVSPHPLDDLPGGERIFEVRAVDAAGNTDPSPAARTWTLMRPAPAPGPQDAPAPDPADQAPALETTALTSVGDATSFLYEGADPIQVGVEPGAIAERRVAVLRGCVRSRFDSPISGVRVSVLDREELGHTSTRDDGCFDIAVNGGGAVTLEFDRQGYLPLQRTVEPGWEEYDRVEQVVLIPYDTQATEVDLEDPAADLQVVRGSEVSDGEGERQATLLFESGTNAVMELPDGSTKPLEDLRVRATEFTIDRPGGGDEGMAAMPGDLPPTSGFTYAAEFSVDQAVKAGATDIRFDKPVITYLENFLDIDVGAPVPAGWYDREEGVWKAGPDGVVIKILAEEGGLAQVDVDGDGLADSGAKLEALGLDGDEQRRLAELYGAGDELWRMALDHFTPWDFNFPWGAPDDAATPKVGDSGGGGGGKGTPKDPGCGKTNSIISCQRQSVGELVPVIGAPFALRYDSDRVPGRADAFNLVVPVGPAPTSAKEIQVSVQVAGKRFAATLPRTATSWLATWDGKDAYGRYTLGEQPAQVEVSYVYDAVYRASSAQWSQSFGALGSGRVVGDRARREISSSQSWTTTMGSWDARAVGLGGWTATIHHGYDPGGRRLLLGDGSEVAVANDVRLDLIEDFAGTGSTSTETLALRTELAQPGGVAIAPDGRVVVAERDGHRVRRIAADGASVERLAGTGYAGVSGDNGPGAEAQLASPHAVAVAPDGSVVIADTLNNRVRRVTADGSKITTVAGGGSPADGVGDGGRATEARLRRPAGVAVGADGSIYVAESAGHRIRRIGGDGLITTAVGTGVAGFSGDGGQGLDAELNGPEGLFLDRDGMLYIADTRNDRIRRLSPGGSLETVAGGGSADGGARDGVLATNATLDRPHAVAMTLGGDLLIADTGNRRVRRVNRDGTITTYAGGGGGNADGAGSNPARVQLEAPVGVAVAPDGTTYIVDSGSSRRRILRVGPALQGFADGDVILPSPDGRQVFQFDASTGRHERTLDAFTRVVIWRFGYDGGGRLASITDRAGKQTQIERDENGLPTAVVGPRGHRTTLQVDAEGWLAKVTDEAGRSHSASFSPTGLIATFTDPAGEESSYSYDEQGRLTASRNVAGGESTYTRTELENGTQVVARDAGGRETTYRNETKTVPRDPANPGAGGVDASVFELILPTGATRTQEALADGTVRSVDEDGMRTTERAAPDPRWGVLVPYTEQSVQQSPGGRTSTTTAARSVQLTDGGNPLMLERQVDSVSVNGRTTTSTFDFSSLTLTQQSPQGRRHVVTFGAAAAGAAHGLPVTTRDDSLEPTTMTYDQWGNVTRVAQGSRETVTTYDDRGRPIQVLDALGRGREYSYDAVNRVVSSAAADADDSGANVPTIYSYDPRGMLGTVTTPDGVTTSLGYDEFGQIGSWQGPAASLAGALPAAGTWQRRPDGSLRQKTTVDGRVRQHEYDGGGRESTITLPEATVTHAYIGKTMRPAELTRTQGGSVERNAFTYDGVLPTGEAASGSAVFSTSYAYDPYDKGISSATMTSGADTITTAYQRDSDGKALRYGPYAIARGGPLGSPSTYTAGDDVLSFAYDAQARTRERIRTVASQPVHRLAFERDAAEQISAVTQQVAGGAEIRRSFEYDEEGRLRAVSEGGVEVERYSYDLRGNRISAVSAGATDTTQYDRQDRITTHDGVPSYGYDLAGRLTSRGSDTFAYDADGHLLSATVGGDDYSFAYDALGRRISKTGPAGTWSYLYGDPADVERVTAVRGPGGVLTTLRYDETGLLVAIERSGTRFAVAVDQVGTPVIVADPSGAIVKQIRRTAYGVLLDDSDPSFYVPIGFGGGLDDRELGLVHLGARDYEPVTARFTIPDPAGFGGGQTNLYSYVGGNPVSLRDPTGLAPRGELGPYDGGGSYAPEPYYPPRAPDAEPMCVGGAVFVVFGAGYKHCSHNGKRITCFEFGAGAGAEVTLDAPDKLPDVGGTWAAKGGGGVGAAGIGGQITAQDGGKDECGRQNGPKWGGAVSGGVGPLGVENGTDGKKWGWGKGEGIGKAGLSGRVSWEDCFETP